MDVTTRVNDLLAKCEPFCLVTVIESQNPNAKPGLKFIVRTDGAMESGVEVELLDSSVRQMAQKALREKKRRLVDLDSGLRVFLDVFEPETRLIICGAGHIAIPLARNARNVGFKVTVLDDRADFANTSRFEDCDVIAEEFTTALRDLPMNDSNFVVIITRGHVHDADCLREILKKETAYVGLIGSRRRVRFVLEMMGQQGASKKRLREVFTPIGAPIGAESPEEIALSITAELVCVRRKGHAQARALRAAVGIDS